MNLILFDLDGTLTDTMADDGRIYSEALNEIAGGKVALKPWAEYKHVTDAGIARAALTAHFQRPAREGEIYSVREAYVRRWEQALEGGAVTVRPIPGALEVFAEALQRPGFVAAIATGSWGPVAAMKLGAAGFPLEQIVLASCDDAEIRDQILRTAGIHAAAARGCFGFSRTIVVGDGVWDARAAVAVKGGFVGVAVDDVAIMQLRAEGAAAVVPDYRDRARFWAGVDAALNQGTAAKRN